LNGHIERLIGSVRHECLDHIVVMGEASLRRTLRAGARYYNEGRTHRSLDKDTCNPRCKNGGLTLWRALHTYGSGKHHIACDGHEGFIRGHQKGPRCDNRFFVFMTFEGTRNWQDPSAAQS
jgi:hypothetical protein